MPMPVMSIRRDKSWLSPKRRCTTGNLNSLPSGQAQTQQQRRRLASVSQAAAPAPAPAPAIVAGRAGNDDAAKAGTPLSPLPTTPRTSRPATPTLHEQQRRPPVAPSTPRPLSQPLLMSARLDTNGTGGEGEVEDGSANLFYAYARRGDDLQSRYLLTFASANIANEWWSLLQEHFHDCTRPGPQLFSFKDPDLLSKAWKNPNFAHLKSKWMYISFSDTNQDRLGGAAQGIIPVQDAKGHLLGGSAPASPEFREVRKETREVKGEMGRLEQRFDRMLGAVERNTEQVVALVENTQQGKEGRHGGVGDAFDLNELSSYLEKINDSLARNSDSAERLATRQLESDKEMQTELEELNSQRKKDQLDLSQLSSHLDRIQSLMEQSLTERKDGIERHQTQQQPVHIDFSPLTDRLEKVQEAVEQNSALIKALLDEGVGRESKAALPVGGKDTPPSQLQRSDLLPLTDHLEKIHGAIEQQSDHMKALVGFASGSEDAIGSASSDRNGDSHLGSGTNGVGRTAERSLAPLGEHLEQIYNAIEEGNVQAREQRQIDLRPLLEAQNATRLAVEAGSKIELSPLVEKFDGLIEHLKNVRNESQSVDGQLRQLIQKQNELQASLGGNNNTQGLDVSTLVERLDGVNEHLESLREWTEFNAEQWQAFVTTRASSEDDEEPTPVDLASLTEKFDALTTHLSTLVENQQQTPARLPPPSTEIDLTPLTERLNRIHASLERQITIPPTAQTDNSAPGAGDPKFLISALTSHLSRIQAITEANAQHVSRLASSHSTTREKMHVAVAETSEQVRGLVGFVGQQESRLEAMSSQVRELMAGQREMVEVVRELARGVKEGGRGAGGGFEHVVIPPPRKVGRKVVGFVYDGKEGG